MGKEIADAVKLLTHDPERDSTGDWLADYHSYVQEIRDSDNELAIAVKRADLTMNMDISRIPQPTAKDYERIERKYKPALEIINRVE